MNDATDATPGAMLEWDEEARHASPTLPIAVGEPHDGDVAVTTVGIVRRDHVEDGTATGWVAAARRQFQGEDSFIRYHELTKDLDDWDEIEDLDDVGVTGP